MHEPKRVKGIIIPAAIIASVMHITGHDARLCMNGIFLVRIMCTMSVCDSRPSTNHPDWNSDYAPGELHPNTCHMSR